MTTTTHRPTLLLIAGFWLGSWAWDEVLDHLGTARSRALAVTLPGVDEDDPDRAERTLEDQAAALLTLLEHAAQDEEQSVVLVAHSGANRPVSLVLDRRPELVRRIIWVDSGPIGPDTGGTDPVQDPPELPLPSFEEMGEQSSLDGLSPGVLERFRSRAVPVPGHVHADPVVLADDAHRRAVPTTLVCSSLPSAQVLDLAAQGHPRFAEVALLESARTVDLPTGHWPMWSLPGELAGILLCEADRTA